METHTRRVLWLDVSAGVAGDMLLGALLDAGAELSAVTAAIEAVVPAEVDLHRAEATRAGLRGCKVDVASAVEEHSHRTWVEVRRLLDQASLDEQIRDRAVAVFARLAAAESRVHGIPVEDVHFHEVGAWDSIADVVGVCAALHALAVEVVTAGPVAVGSGWVRAAHGRLPVPVPAVLELARGYDVHAGGDGELATPTGMAVLAALAEQTAEIPAMRVEAIGVGAGTRDGEGRANVVRAVLGTSASPHTSP